MRPVPSRETMSVELVLFLHANLFLIITLHHLHAFEHPRHDTVAIVAILITLLTRQHLIVEAWHLHCLLYTSPSPRDS